MLKPFLFRQLKRLPFKTHNEFFYQSARLMGVRGVLVDGEHGPMLGAAGDRAIMRSYLRDHRWSPELRTPIMQALRHGGQFVDVGANIGLVALDVARMPGVTVHALEPDEENFSFLLANIAMHRLTNVRALQCAAWHRHEELTFTRNAYNSGDHHLAGATEAGLKVRAAPLDSLEVGAGPLVVKIDTQGAEPAVLQGAQALLARA